MPNLKAGILIHKIKKIVQYTHIFRAHKRTKKYVGQGRKLKHSEWWWFDVSWAGCPGIQKKLESFCLQCQRSLLCTWDHNRASPFFYASLSKALNLISVPPIIDVCFSCLLSGSAQSDKNRSKLQSSHDFHYRAVWFCFFQVRHKHRFQKQIQPCCNFQLFCRPLCWPHVFTGPKCKTKSTGRRLRCWMEGKTDGLMDARMDSGTSSLSRISLPPLQHQFIP